MLQNTEDVHASFPAPKNLLRMKAAVAPRLKMTGFIRVKVQRQIEIYAHTFNFSPQQNKLKVVSLKRSLSVVFSSGVGLCTKHFFPV